MSIKSIIAISMSTVFPAVDALTGGLDGTNDECDGLKACAANMESNEEYMKTLGCKLASVNGISRTASATRLPDRGCG